MEYLNLGRSGLKVSRLCLGTMNFGPLTSEADIPPLIFVYLDGRQTLGHYVEFTWKSPEAWEFVGWPEGRPVW